MPRSAAGRSWSGRQVDRGDAEDDDGDGGERRQSSRRTPGSRRRTPPRRLQQNIATSRGGQTISTTDGIAGWVKQHQRAATNFAAWCEQFAQDCYPTASRLRFEPGPFCARVQHANHSATEPPQQQDKGKKTTNAAKYPICCLRYANETRQKNRSQPDLTRPNTGRP